MESSTPEGKIRVKKKEYTGKMTSFILYTYLEPLAKVLQRIDLPTFLLKGLQFFRRMQLVHYMRISNVDIALVRSNPKERNRSQSNLK